MKKRIYYLIAGVLATTAVTFVSCSDDDDKGLPEIDGYNNSDEVASDNLVAHWTFDNTNVERLSDTEPEETFGTVGFTDGPIDGALKLTEGALVYPSITAIGEANSLNNYTISLWVNIKNTGDSFTTLFGIFPTENTEPWGNLSLGVETSSFPADGPIGDTLVFKTNYKSLRDDGSVNGQDNRPDPKGTPPVGVFKAAGQWAHYVVRFNATTHMLQIFGNGESIGAYDFRQPTTTELVMATPAQAVFGSLSTSDIGFTSAGTADFQRLADASIDDVRVYNTALADTEITALYNLGSAGR